MSDSIPRDRLPVRPKLSLNGVHPNGRLKQRPQFDKLVDRMMGLTSGRFQIILTKHPSGEIDWTVSDIGKVEY